METFIAIAVIVNLVVTAVLAIRLRPITIEIVSPLSVSDVIEIETETPEEQEPVSVNAAPVPPTDNNVYSPWINRSEIPWNETQRKAEPPAEKPEGYGFVR